MKWGVAFNFAFFKSPSFTTTGCLQILIHLQKTTNETDSFIGDLVALFLASHR